MVKGALEEGDEGWVSVSISMSPTLHGEGKALASRQDINFSQLMRKLLRDFLERETSHVG